MSAQILFSAADATWRREAARALNLDENDPGLAEAPEARGRPDSLLRVAYEVRQRAFCEWRRQNPIGHDGVLALPSA